MKHKIKLTTFCFVLICLFSSGIWAQGGQLSLESLKKKIETLSNEIDELTQGVFSQEHHKHGDGAANKVYHKERGLSIGGYGEFIYSHFADELADGTESTKADLVDFRRNVIYVGYKFKPWLVLNTEIEIEHVDEIFLEFGYLDFLIKDYFNIRAGLLLVPMGFVNELHEFPAYLGSNRSVTEQHIIPTTWREVGVGIWGNYNIFSYKLYLVTSLRGSNFGLSNSGYRKGRQKGAKAIANHFSGVLELGIQAFPFLYLSTSQYYGPASHNELSDRNKKLNMWIADAKADFKLKGIQSRILFAFSTLSDANVVNDQHLIVAMEEIKIEIENGKTITYSEEQIGSQLLGAYFEIGYNVFHEIPNIKHQLIPFVRVEYLNTEWKAAEGYTAFPKNERVIVTAGITYKPIIQIVLKADYEHHYNSAETGQDVINLSAGYMF